MLTYGIHIWLVIYHQSKKCKTGSARGSHVLYEYFASYASFVNQKQKRQAEDWARIQILKKEFHEAKNKLAKATKQMNMTVDYSFEQWKANGKQLLIEFE